VMRLPGRLLPMMLLVVSASCCPQKSATREKIYEGPTQTLSEVVADINRNNQRINTLWARGNFRAWFRDDRNAEQYVDGDCNLQYRKPQDLNLTGKDAVLGPIFQVGSNSERYWLLVKPKIDTLWWGRYANADADVSKMPIRPDLLLEVLGVGDINPDFRQQPLPVLKFNNDRDVYMITWHVMRPDRLVAQKEVWYDRQTKRPRLVNLFDDNGRIVLRAYLSNHKSIQSTDEASESRPTVATAYDLYFPESKAKIVLTLSEVRSTYNGFPKDFSFRFPGSSAAAKEIAIDEQQQSQR